jgi:glycosyltransferase involved in cell wall biosynthesis
VVTIRILLHSNSPWVGTGYGQQCAIWAPRLASLGHEVIISAFWGLNGASTQWNGHLVLPGGQDPYGSDIIVSHARYVKADLVITLMDVWPLDANQVRSLRADHGIPVAHWMPVDCNPLGVMDERHLKATGAIPVAMSRYGQAKLAEAGLDSLYVPHGIEATRTFTPGKRDEARKALGVDDRFVIAMNAANKDAIRKGFPEQMLAFARFRKKHPEALLMMHSLAMAPGALDLQGLASRLGILDSVRFADQYAYLTGLLTPQAMAAWMSAADVGSNCSYGEGFGLAPVEFQACETPVVVTDATAMTELAGPGWKVKGEPFWNSAHAAWWTRPSPAGIVKAYEAAFDRAAHRRQPSRKFALQYDADTVLTQYWKPALDTIMERAHSASTDPIRPSARALHDRMRDTVTERLELAHADGVLDAAEFGRRAHRATIAESGAELSALLADLPAKDAA